MGNFHARRGLGLMTAAWAKSGGEKNMICASFDGTCAAYKDNLSITDNKISASIWYKNTDDADDWRQFFGIGGKSGNTASGVYLRRINKVVSCMYQQYGTYQSSGELDYGQWHNIVVCCNKNRSSPIVYLDGELCINGTYNSWDAGLTSINKNVCIGSGVEVVPTLWGASHCDIANVNIYRERFLTSDEASELASSINYIPTDANHQYLFENSDGLDTGTDGGWDLNVMAGVVFKKV